MALERRGGVARALPGDRVAALTGKADDLDDVVGRLGDHHSCRALVGGEVPRLPRLVPGIVARCGNGAGDAVTKWCELLDQYCAHGCAPDVPGRCQI